MAKQNLVQDQQQEQEIEIEIEQEQPPQDSERRSLYEQPRSKTLVFTTSTSNHLQQTYKTSESAVSGIYQCTLEPHVRESRESCHKASKLADHLNFAGSKHSKLVLRNLQFDLSSLRSASNNNAAKNYLYANSYSLHDEGSFTVPDWEIVRAKLPNKDDFDNSGGALNEDGTLRFESVFQTLEAVNWNECDFDCCIKDDKINEPWKGDEHKEYRHAYVMTMVRSFVVDEHTGDIFVSWEGFYKDCGSVNLFAPPKKLQWTIGVSRLKTEDPSCTSHYAHSEAYLSEDKTRNTMGHFPNCTDPVSIVYQSSRGREVVLPYGGFAVIPASSTEDTRNSNYDSNSNNRTRSFLLSVLISPGIDMGTLTSSVWALSEGVDASKENIQHQDVTGVGNGTVVDNIFMDANVWDGGSLRVHYNAQTGKPDHLCRTVFVKGIECMPIDVTIEDGLPVVASTGPSESFLSKDQTAFFCRLGDADTMERHGHPRFGRETTFVTGLDVQWDLEGKPERIFFGCWGGESFNGNFGSVEKHGNKLQRVMHGGGAYADGVLFWPLELEGTIDPREPLENLESVVWNPDGTRATASPRFEKDEPVSLLPFSETNSGVAVFLVSLLVAACLVVVKKKRQRYSSSPNELRKETGFGTPYVELQVNDCEDSFGIMLAPLPSP